MNATKRKFNALLNGIGNKSTTSLSSKDVNNVDLSSSADVDLQAKKRRLVPSASASNKAPFPKSTVSANHKKSASTASEALTSEPPKYAPWDRTAFLKRLKSFSNLTDWTPKPAKVNEVEWAKRGWVCQKSERVRCCLCNVEILVKLNRKNVDGKEEPVYIAQNIEDALVEKYVELIISSHDEDCLWKRRGCDDTIFKLPLNHAPTTIQGLRNRYNELCTRNNKLPYPFNIRLPPGVDSDLVLSYLPPGTLDSSEITVTAAQSTNINKVAFQLALFGWQGHTHERLGAQLESVSCQACFRVLGLWLFKSKKVNEAGEEVEGAVVDCLDVVNQHRDYCPWRNAASQNGPKVTVKSSTAVLAGWEVIIRVLKNDYYLQHSGEQQAEKTIQVSADNVSEISTAFGADIEDDEARSIRDEKDKERWARLRRVKSLFDTKSGKKLHRTGTDAKSKAQA